MENKIRILHISDIHNNFEGLEYRTDVDVVVNTGDAQCHTREEFFAFLEWFENYPIKDKIYVAGNHDIFIDNNKAFCENLFKERGITYLNKNSVTLHGLKFYGEPIVPRYGNWAFMTDRSKMDKHWEYIPKDVDVLLTHTPPKGILDLSENRQHELEMCGCSALSKRIKNLPNLKLHCFGHIHCLTPDYEVLTQKGWKFHNNVSEEDKVLNLNLFTKKLEYDSVKNVIKSEYEGDIYKIKNSYFEIDMTPKHKVVHFNKQDVLTYTNIEDIYKDIKVNNPVAIPVSFDYEQKDYEISDNEIKLMVWVATDSNREGNRWRFHLSKIRKIKRLKELLNELNINFNEGVKSKTGSLKISFEDKNFKYSKPLPEIIKLFSKRQCKILINEYFNTDGNFITSDKYPNMVGQLSSSKKEEIDLLMEVLIKSGYKFTGYNKKNHHTHHCNINVSKDKVRNFRKKHITKYNYKGLVWCLETNNGNFIIRKDGKIMLTGNSSSAIVNHGTRIIDGVTFSNATAVTDREFDKGITFEGNLIEL